MKRVQAARTRLVPVAGRLRAGETVIAGVARLFAEAGCPGGVVFLGGLAMYVASFFIGGAPAEEVLGSRRGGLMASPAQRRLKHD